MRGGGSDKLCAEEKCRAVMDLGAIRALRHDALVDARIKLRAAAVSISSSGVLGQPEIQLRSIVEQAVSVGLL